jgi:hypothetical protein
MSLDDKKTLTILLTKVTVIRLTPEDLLLPGNETCLYCDGCDEPAEYLICGTMAGGGVPIGDVRDELLEFTKRIREEFGCNIEIPVCEIHSERPQ